MNKKIQIISMLFSGLLIITFSGCDWCGCCKKNSCGTEAPEKSTVHEKTEPKTPAHPVEPEAKEPAKHLMPVHSVTHPEPIHPVAHPTPVHPIEHSVAQPAVHPEVPKVAPAPKAP